MKLAKWQGLGNDYLIVERRTLTFSLTPETIGLLCDRHLGVGADGILLVEEPSGAIPEAAVRMRVFNPDGSEPEMCGNGIRMFARYLVETGALTDSEFVVETLAGPIRPRLLPDGRVRVDMGRARFHSANIDVGFLGPGDARVDRNGAPAEAEGAPRDVASEEAPAEVVDVPLEIEGRTLRFTFVDVGNPHCVVLVDDPAEFDVAGVGPLIEHHPVFPHRANVEFIRVEDDGSVRMRVWERGVGETQACGTGATAVGAATVRLGLTTSPVLVHLLGGDLTIEVEAGSSDEEAGGRSTPGALPASSPGSASVSSTAAHGALPASSRGSASASSVSAPRVFMTGPAEEVFVCELSLDLLRRLERSGAAVTRTGD